MKIKIKLFLFTFFISVCGNVVAVYPAKAIEYGQIGGRPANPDQNVPDSKSWFIYHLEPGQSKEDALEVINLFQEPWDALIYAADSVKSSSGGFALKQFSEYKSEVGSWVRFYPDPKPDFAAALFSDGRDIHEACGVDAETLSGKTYKFTEQQISDFSEWCKGKNDVMLTLAGGEKKQVPFVISVPENAEVGEHTGGILIQKQSKDAVSQDNGSRVLLTTRVGVRIYETVPGEIVKDLRFSDFSIKKNFDEFFLPWNKEKKDKFGEYVINSVAVNGGNVSTEFSEKIIMHNRFFGKDIVIDGRDFQVLRADRFDSTLAWIAPRFGRFDIHKEYVFKDAGGVEKNVSSETISLWLVPWRESVFSIALLIVLGIAYFWWKRRNVKLYGGIGWISYKIKKTDSVVKIAQEYGIGWKVLVRTNKLKAPYILEEGQEILVPPSVKNIKSENKKLTVKKNKSKKDSTNNIETAAVIARPSAKKVAKNKLKVRSLPKK